MRRIVAIAISFILALSVAAPIAVAVAQEPPTEADGTFTVKKGRLCEFPVRFEVSGTTKMIESPGGGVIFIFPGLTATLTNVDNPENQETLSVTGSFHDTVLENGNVERVFTGRNLLFFPEVGFVLAVGEFSIVFDQKGKVVQPLSGEGQLIDVCALLT
jgi:hypothetical protein